MSDPRWAVTLVLDFEGAPPELDELAEAFAGSDAAFSLTGNELTVMASAQASHSRDAEWVIEDQLHKFSANHGFKFNKTVEVRVLPWERWEAELETSNLPDLVSAPEVGEILGVSRQRVHQLLSENQSFPPPLVRLGSGPVWLRSTIEAFDASWSRRPGRPKLRPDLPKGDVEMVGVDRSEGRA